MLCEEYSDIFSQSSTDLGRTPLLTMEIETGDSLPICQKPYNLPYPNMLNGYKEKSIC